MKKILSLLFVFIIISSFCSCGNGSNKNTLHLMETISTDIVDFSIDDAKFTIYASAAHNSTYLSPTDKKSAYAAPTGKSIVVISFTVNNKDRASTISIGSPFGSTDDKILKLNWKIKYKGKTYSISGLKEDGFNMSPSVIINKYTQDVIKEIDTINHLLSAGRSESYRIAGIVDFEPESLNDTFEIQATIPDSKENYTKFTYVTEFGENSGELFYNNGTKLMEQKEYFNAMKNFELAKDYPGAKEKYDEAQLMYYLLNPTSDEASSYFAKNKENYQLLNSDEIASIIVGEWSASTNYGDPITFRGDGIIENEYISDGTWSISGNNIVYTYHSKDTTNICEMRKIKEGIYLLFKDGQKPVISLKAIN